MELSRRSRGLPSPGWGWVVGVALPLVGSGCVNSDRDLGPGGELAITAVGNCIGPPPPQGPWPGDDISYSNNRVFLETQGWWGERQPNGSVPKYGDAEHIHVGMCFPLQDTVSGDKTMRVLVRGHNLPVGSIIETTALHDASQWTFKTITWNRTVTAADNGDVILTQDVLVHTTDVPSGDREFRNLTTVKRPNQTEIHVSSGWCWVTSNGGATGDSGSCGTKPLTTVGRGWYDCFEYKLAETRDWAYPYGGITAGQPLTVSVAGYDGAGANTDFTGWEVRWDPDFHAGVKGDSIKGGFGSAFGVPATVPGSKVTGPAGTVHKLVVIGYANNPNCNTPTGAGIKPQHGEVSGILFIPVKVR